MAIGIVAVLVGVVMSRVDRERARLDSQVQVLGLAMNAAQRDAVLRQHDVRIAFDVGGRRVRVHRDTNNDGIVDLGERETVIALDDDVLFGLAGADPLSWGPGPVTFAAGPGGHPTLTFHRNGSASEFGAVYLSSRKAEAGYDRALAVERATGEVRCHSHRTGTWELAC
jgi:type II secretory pathway pseudopilin PulG